MTGKMAELQGWFLNLPRAVRLSVGFLLGFCWDLMTLRRIDDLGDNVGVLGGLLVLGLFVSLSLRTHGKRRIGGVLAHSVWVMGGVIVAYQIFALFVGHMPLAWQNKAAVLCADGCWLPSLGASGFWDHAECVVALFGGVALILFGRRVVQQRDFLQLHRNGFSLIRQFLWGNVFAAYLIFYFQSADLGPAFLYVALIGVLLGANEFLPKRDSAGLFDLAAYLFATFSFCLYVVPVVVAYLPGQTTKWQHFRNALLMPGTWAPFVAAVVFAVLATAVVAMVGSGGRIDDGTPKSRWRWGLLERFAVQLGTWAVVIFALVFLRVLEAIPPAPLALKEIHLSAKTVQSTKGCSGPVIPKSGSLLFDQFQFPDDRRTRVVLDATVFAPRHVTIPVTFRWEYFHFPGWSGTWWDPKNWWHDTQDGRASSVSGWGDNGFAIQSCKRVFKGAHGSGMRPFWRITFSTPGDRGNRESEGLLETREYKLGRTYFWLSEGVTPSW